MYTNNHSWNQLNDSIWENIECLAMKIPSSSMANKEIIAHEGLVAWHVKKSTCSNTAVNSCVSTAISLPLVLQKALRWLVPQYIHHALRSEVSMSCKWREEGCGFIDSHSTSTLSNSSHCFQSSRIKEVPSLCFVFVRMFFVEIVRMVSPRSVIRGSRSLCEQINQLICAWRLSASCETSRESLAATRTSGVFPCPETPCLLSI